MYQTLYDEPGLAGIGERCAALIERCAPRMMVAGGGGVPGLWRERSPALSAETKAAMRAEWIAAASARSAGVTSRKIMERIAQEYDVDYQTVCRVTRDLRAGG